MNAQQLSHTHYESELVIGLVAAVGARTGMVVSELTNLLVLAGYDVVQIKLSETVIPDLITPKPFGRNQFRRYMSFMQAGNDARRNADDKSIVAKGAAAKIDEYRTEAMSKAKGTEERDGSLPRTAYIIDSLKRPEEVDMLRIIYSSGFLLLGVHDELHRRIDHLCNDKKMKKKQALKLVERDKDEKSDKFGQKVNSTFHLADCFVALTGSYERLGCDLRRIVELCFGNPFITPTFDELAMFQAFSTALRSADLSRQVGAVVTRDQQILGTGANECPSAGGGLYWPRRVTPSSCVSDADNGRDFQRGYDSNKHEQRKIAKRLAKQIAEKGNKDQRKMIFQKLLAGDIRDLTEYGRVVHAEMEAMLSCARQGIAIQGAELYSTTFPCHNCAKHIIAGGIRRVVYVEPYAKSKALDFHDDSILTPGKNIGDKKTGVLFEPFVGVGPRRFFDLFSMHLGSTYPLDRKNSDTGKKLPWSLGETRLRLQVKPVSYLQFEKLAATDFYESIEFQG